MPEKVNVAFDPEVDLTDDAVSRSRYERFYSVREKSSSKTFARAQSNGVPLKERSRVKLRRLTRVHISKNIPKSSKILNYTRRAHVLRDVM